MALTYRDQLSRRLTSAEGDANIRELASRDVIENMILNPHGSIDQDQPGSLRSATTASATVGPIYMADQWIFALSVATSGAVAYGLENGSVSAYDPCNLFIRTSTLKASLGAGDYITAFQPLEGTRMRKLLYGGSTARVSIARWRASASQNGVASFALRNNGGTRSFVSPFSVTTTPTDFAVVIPGDATGTWTNGVAQAGQFGFCFAAGTTYQTSTYNAWQNGNLFAAATQTNMLDTVNRKLQISDVGFYDVDFLPKFQPIDLAIEMMQLYRYYWCRIATATNEALGVVGQAYATNAVACHMPTRVTMRVTPSIDVNSDATAISAANSGAAWVSSNSIQAGAANSPNSAVWNMTMNSASFIVSQAAMLSLTGVGNTIRHIARM